MINTSHVNETTDVQNTEEDALPINADSSSFQSILQTLTQTIESYSPTEIAISTLSGAAGAFLLGAGTFMLLPYLPVAGLVIMVPGIVPLAPVVTLAGYAVTGGVSAAGASGAVRVTSVLYSMFSRTVEEPVAETSNSASETLQVPPP